MTPIIILALGCIANLAVLYFSPNLFTAFCAGATTAIFLMNLLHGGRA